MWRVVYLATQPGFKPRDTGNRLVWREESSGQCLHLLGGREVGGQVNNPSYLEGPQEDPAGTGLRGWSYPTCRTLSTTGCFPGENPETNMQLLLTIILIKILLYTYCLKQKVRINVAD